VLGDSGGFLGGRVGRFLFRGRTITVVAAIAGDDKVDNKSISMNDEAVKIIKATEKRREFIAGNMIVSRRNLHIKLPLININESSISIFTIANQIIST
jgi:hypothetical protein